MQPLEHVLRDLKCTTMESAGEHRGETPMKCVGFRPDLFVIKAAAPWSLVDSNSMWPGNGP